MMTQLSFQLIKKGNKKTMSNPSKINIIGDIINNAYGRARKSWEAREIEGYQKLAQSQTEDGCQYLDVNIDGTQSIMVRQQEMIDFIPTLIPALQEATDVPLCFDNPAYIFHKTCMENYDFSKGGKPILNSIAASRTEIDELLALVKKYDTKVLVMASERYLEGTSGDSGQCFSADEVYQSAKVFVKILKDKTGRINDDIIIDPGLAPVGADTYGLVNMGLDAMKMITEDDEMHGVHFSVGLSNFAWGTPKLIRHELERAYLTLGSAVGLDMALANSEKNPTPLDASDPLIAQLKRALDAGRVVGDESQEDAGFRQAEGILDICAAFID